MKKFIPPLAAVFFSLTLFSATSALAENTAVVPAPRDANWVKRHEALLAESQARKDSVDLLFIGDSITDGWDGKGKAVYDKYYVPRNVLNLGIGGDRTQHVLWRLQHGEVDGLHPKATVLLIGINNTSKERDGSERNTAPEVIEGVTAVVKEIQQRLPKTKLLLLAVFPYKQKGDPMRDKVDEINKGIRKLGKRKNVTFLDINKKFLEPDGTLSTNIMPDLLHPNERGYQIWAEAMEPTLKKLMK